MSRDVEVLEEAVGRLEGDPAADMYWTNVAFGPNDTVLVTLVNRGQDHLALTSFDAKTGEKLGTLLTEHDRQWVEPEHPPQFLRDGKFLWRSRRSGYRHVYLHEPSGERIRRAVVGGTNARSPPPVAQAIAA